MRENRAVVTIDEQESDAQDPGPRAREPEARGSGDLASGGGDASSVDGDATHPATESSEPDAVCAAATDLARSAAEEIAEPGSVGEYLGVTVEENGVVTHRFSCSMRGYRGWHWAVTLARTPGAAEATVSETVLLPGSEAVLSPTWVPWSDRLQPGDLGAQDALPRRPDDPNLVPGFEQVALEHAEDADLLQVWELGLGRHRVLGPYGREAAVHRWYSGDHGPTAQESVYAAEACATCGYLMPLAGTLRQVFGVCANEWSPSDGRVVSLDHGCGAHSESDVEQPEPIPLPEPALDEIGADAVIIDRQETPGDDGTPGGPDAVVGAETGPGVPGAEPAADGSERTE
jgi:hypothetical protein